MKFEVFRTKLFNKKVSKLSKKEQYRIKKLEKELTKNPYVGKPLGKSHLREKKIKEKRVYYTIYQEFVTVLLVQLSGKKNQQETIDLIKRHFKLFYNEMKEIRKKN